MRLSLILFCMLFASTASARTIGVPSDASTIQAGINAASSGDTVLVQPGRHFESIDFKGKDIVVGSLYLATRDSSYIINTIIHASWKNTVVTFQSGETSAAELCGFTITAGVSQGSVMNHLNPGGGICCKNASPYLHHLIVEGNESQLEGGGLYLEKSDSVVEYCVIRNNFAVGEGGGLNLYKGNHIITNCIIDNNLGYGGGIHCVNSIASIYKVLMTNNRQNTMIISSSEMNIINCTIANNDPEIYIYHSKVNIVNSIFWNINPQIIITGHNDHPELPISCVSIAYSNIRGGKDKIIVVGDSLYYKDNNINIDPLFKDMINNDFSLKPNSPCINSGVAYYQIGDSVIENLKKEEYKGSAPDLGAFESDYTSTIVNENNICTMSLFNYPNPFNSITTIHYSLSRPGHVSLSIYSITGQKVIDLLDKTFPVGNYKIKWNGKDKLGNNISSGIYFLQLHNEMYSITKRLVYLK